VAVVFLVGVSVPCKETRNCTRLQCADYGSHPDRNTELVLAEDKSCVFGHGGVVKTRSGPLHLSSNPGMVTQLSKLAGSYPGLFMSLFFEENFMEQLKNIAKLLGSKRSIITLASGGVSLYTLIKNITVPSVVITVVVCITVLGLGYMHFETKRKS